MWGEPVLRVMSLEIHPIRVFLIALVWLWVFSALSGRPYRVIRRRVRK